MRAFLLFLSSLLSICGLQTSAAEADIAAVPAQRYAFQMEMSRGYLSGVMMTKQTDSEITGSVINEFGVAALSFRYDIRGKKVKLIDVIGFLDKWYIRKILKNDIRFCLDEFYGMPNNHKGNYVVSYKDDTLTITNRKRKITYSFTPMPNTDQNHDTE